MAGQLIDTWPELSVATGSIQFNKALEEHLVAQNTMLTGQVLLKEGGVLSVNNDRGSTYQKNIISRLIIETLLAILNDFATKTLFQAIWTQRFYKAKQVKYFGDETGYYKDGRGLQFFYSTDFVTGA